MEFYAIDAADLMYILVHHIVMPHRESDVGEERKEKMSDGNMHDAMVYSNNGDHEAAAEIYEQEGFPELAEFEREKAEAEEEGAEN